MWDNWWTHVWKLINPCVKTDQPVWQLINPCVTVYEPMWQLINSCICEHWSTHAWQLINPCVTAGTCMRDSQQQGVKYSRIPLSGHPLAKGKWPLKRGWPLVIRVQTMWKGNTASHEDDSKLAFLIIFLAATFYFRLLTVKSWLKTKPNFELYILAGH